MPRLADGPPRVLTLWADDRSPNLGVRTLAAGAEALVRSIWPDASVHHHDFGSPLLPVPMGSPRSATRELITARGGVATWLAGYDIILDTRSGDSLTDIYGRRRLTTMTLMAEVVRRSGTPLAMAPQTIGPFHSITGRLLARRALSGATVVMARDPASSRRASRLGRPETVPATDVVFALPPSIPERRRDVLVNVSGLLWAGGPHVDAERYRATILAVMAELTGQGRQVTLLPHVLAGGTSDDDVAVLPEILQRLGREIEVAIPRDLTHARSIIAGADLLIGSRMHACLNALSQGVPAIPMAYSDKFAPLLDSLDYPFAVDVRSDPAPTRAVLALSGRADLVTRAAAVPEVADARLAEARQSLADLFSGAAGR